MNRHSWIVSNPRVDQIMKRNRESLWKDLLLHMKNEYTEWVNYPIDPQLN